LSKAVDELVAKKFDLDTTKIQEKIDKKLLRMFDDEGTEKKLDVLEKKDDSLKTKDTKGKAEFVLKQSKPEEGQKKKGFTPLFDPFGITPDFYIKGKSQTKSWIGCFCSLVEITITITVFFFYTRSYIRKDSPNITILDLKSDEKPFFDLNFEESKQLLILTHFIAGMDPKELWPLNVYMVVENTKTKTVEKTSIPIIECTQDLFDGLRVGFKPREVLEYQFCVTFSKGTLIGKDKKAGIKRSIHIEAVPCLVNCYKFTFPAPIGLQEIRPNNPFPANVFPVYQTYMHSFNI